MVLSRVWGRLGCGGLGYLAESGGVPRVSGAPPGLGWGVADGADGGVTAGVRRGRPASRGESAPRGPAGRAEVSAPRGLGRPSRGGDIAERQARRTHGRRPTRPARRGTASRAHTTRARAAQRPSPHGRRATAGIGARASRRASAGRTSKRSHLASWAEGDAPQVSAEAQATFRYADVRPRHTAGPARTRGGVAGPWLQRRPVEHDPAPSPFSPTASPWRAGRRGGRRRRCGRSRRR